MKEGIYRRNLLVPFLKMVLDALTIELATIFSYYLRFYSPLVEVLHVKRWHPVPPLEKYLYFSWLIILIYLLLFGTFRSYRSRFFSTFAEDIPVILKTCFLGMLFAMSAAFMYRGFSYSRLVFLLIFMMTNIFLIIERYFFHHLKKKFLKKGFNLWHTVLVGSAEKLPSVYKQLAGANNHQFRFTGYVAEKKLADISLPYLGDINSLPELLFNGSCDGLILALTPTDHQQILSVIASTEGKNIELFYIPDIVDLLPSRLHALEVGGIPMLQLKSFTLSGWQGFLKRLFDIVFSFLGLILLSPLFLLLALLIKLTSRGPVFYKQKRVGLEGVEFTMLKFRSLVVDQEDQSGLVDVQKEDPRVTPIGRFLRRTSLDELPQLINVLKGDMSLVGPRPERTYYVNQYLRSIPHFSERHRVRCGITGWAQVNGKRQSAPWKERVEYDLYYIENWSLWFDIKIIILTFIAILKGENAY